METKGLLFLIWTIKWKLDGERNLPVTSGAHDIMVVAPLELTVAWRLAALVRGFHHGMDQNEVEKVRFLT
jgi:hypothetical protein